MSTEGTKIIAPLRGGGAVMAIIPQDIDQVWRMAGMAVMGQMAPKSLVENKSFEEAQAACAIAIMAGAELGMTPLTALRSYAVVNGRPSLWGDGIKSVVRASGKCEYIKAGGDLTKGWCEAKRSDTGEVLRREFTWEQAKRANLSVKKGPWQEHPDMMMERRATFRCLNDLFADVLGGLADAMDPVDPEPMRDITPAPSSSRMVPPPPDDEPIAPPAPDEPEKAETFTNPEEPDASDPDPGSDEWFEKLQQFLDRAESFDDLHSVEHYFEIADVRENAPMDISNRTEEIIEKARLRIDRKHAEAAGQRDMLEGLPPETVAAVKNASTP